MRKYSIIITLLFVGLNTYAQKEDLHLKLYSLEDKIIGGDIKALKELANFIDDKTFVQEFLGHHIFKTNVEQIALRIIEENCLFTQEELKIDSSITTDKFIKIIDNRNVVFDELTGRFLITPLIKRNSNY
ncbi:MAG: hypothetical protein ABUL44_02125, partial [Flavobacterium sp.]